MKSQIVRSFHTLHASSPSTESSQQHWDVDIIFPSFFYTQVMNVAPTVLMYIVYYRLWLLSVLVSYCCCNKLAHTKWLQTVHIYYLTFLWVRCPGCFGWSLGSVSQEARIKVLVSWALISGHSGCWQNPVFVAVSTGVPVSLLAVTWEPFLASADFSPIPPCGPTSQSCQQCMRPSVSWNLWLPLRPHPLLPFLPYLWLQLARLLWF